MSESTDDTTDDPGTIACWDCEREISVRAASWCEVMDHSGDGLGYETYDAPLCPRCKRKRLPSYECGTCGREYPDIEAAATCCPDGMRGPI